MKRKNNAGFSMVEILIALAIFMVLMMPIVQGIITALNRSTDAKELQNRNEFAETVMEHVKVTDISEIVDSKDVSFYESLGATYDSLVPAGEDIMADYDYNGNGKHSKDKSSADYDSGDILKANKYSISGTVELGTKDTTYSYLVTVDNKCYVQGKASNSTFVDPNNLAQGIVEDIDHEKVALIDNSVLNYDSVAADAFYAKKLLAAKTKDPTVYEQELSRTDGSSVFAGDEAARLITIEVSGGSDSNGDGDIDYKVQTKISFIDNDKSKEFLENDNYIEYSLPAKSFKGHLPNIYLMYNPCFYGGNYSSDDYIAIDTTELLTTSDAEGNLFPEVNVFVVETAESYSDDIKQSEAQKQAAAGSVGADYSSIVLDKGDTQLYYEDKNTTNGITRDKVRVHLAGVTTSANTADALKNVKVYHNFGRTGTTDTSLVMYTQDDITADDGALESNGTPKKNNYKKFFANTLYNSTGKKYWGFDVANVLPINKATKDNRGLYEVKVYLKEGNTAPDPKNDLPIIQGTKGGNET